MKILVLSDSHGEVERMELAVRAECPDTTISPTSKSGRLLVMNPGAAGGGSYGVIELDGGKIKGRLGYI